MLKQRVPMIISVVGDGLSSTFSFEFRDLFGVTLPTVSGSNALPFAIINQEAVPDNVEIPAPNTDGVTASVSGRVITLTWPSPLEQDSTSQVEMFLDFPA